MKRIFTVVLAALAMQVSVFAQCPDGNITAPGFHPPADQFPPIERGVSYSEDLQVNIPASFDTVIFGNTVTVSIDSIQVNTITGQPSGISYTCTPSDCKFNGGQAGCVNFSGITNDATGQYPLTVNITAYVTVPVLGQQTQTLNMSDLGFTYYLTVVDAGALSVSVSANPTTICAGESSTLTATVTNGSGSETFAWSDGAGTANPATVSPAATTTYTVTVTDGANTATATATVTVNDLPVAGFTSDDTNMPTIAFDNTSTGATSFAWNFGDTSTGTDTDPNHTYADNGTFTVELIAINSCGSDTTSADVTITGVFIGALESDLQFSVYPNPSEGFFTVTLTNNTGASSTISVYDFSGKKVYEEAISGTAERKLDLSALPKGVYTLHLNSEKSNGVQKLVIR